jgi:hypothetical protein
MPDVVEIGAILWKCIEIKLVHALLSRSYRNVHSLKSY